MEKIVGIIIIFILVVFAGAGIFYWSWNVFAVEILNQKTVTFYQAFTGIFLISSTFGAAKATSSYRS